ncbi:hypothetical protein IFR05_003027 [Cadophora sp. M221]|nr:hypothetical protein IFR05_003027 [Cadophora sp. M221]
MYSLTIVSLINWSLLKAPGGIDEDGLSKELLAPENVVFYDLNWNLAGTRFSLRDRISQITGIRADILKKQFDIQESRNCYCVAEKMSWAATRKTSRVEDLAYCLLGIFDVNMPLLYGESGRAFERLQLQILAETEDLTLLAWKGVWGPLVGEKWYQDSSEFNQLLAPSPAYFAGTTKWYGYQQLVASYSNEAWEIFGSTHARLNVDGKEPLAHMQPTKRLDTLVLNGVLFGEPQNSDQDVLVLCEMHGRRSRATTIRFLCLPIQVREKYGNLVYRKRGIPTICEIDSKCPQKIIFYRRLAICLEPDPRFWGLRDKNGLTRGWRDNEATRILLLNLQCPNSTVKQVFKVRETYTSAVLLCDRTEEFIVICGWHRYGRGSNHTLLPWTTCTSWEGLSAMRTAILTEDDESWDFGDFQRYRMKNGSHLSCRIKPEVVASPDREAVPQRRFKYMLPKQPIFSLNVSVMSAGGRLEPIDFLGAKSFIGYHELQEWLDDENSTHRRDMLLGQNQAGHESGTASW